MLSFTLLVCLIYKKTEHFYLRIVNDSSEDFLINSLGGTG